MAPVSTLTLKVSSKAAAHLRAIEAYIRERNPSAATRVGETIKASFELLRRYPYAGRPGRSSGTREKSVSRYPYVVVYEILQPDVVVILGVYHTAQNERKI
ncbi:MAG TPA: type II toxin-antitoxin system RelE/ParE family toxin [Rhizomicrobium sp.]|nr:type II toxin-antitoxin system RelE/ParE family toxin [Rhizomicrobium sp.]